VNYRGTNFDVRLPDDPFRGSHGGGMGMIRGATCTGHGRRNGMASRGEFECPGRHRRPGGEKTGLEAGVYGVNRLDEYSHAV